MPIDHRERAFEAAIEYSLLNDGGYSTADPANFDRARALDPTLLLPVIRETQPKDFTAIQTHYGDRAEKVLLDDLCHALDAQGMLDVLRHGFKCFGKLLRAAYFAPASGLNPD